MPYSFSGKNYREESMATYRVSPQFIFVFISAAIILAFFIHRYQMATTLGQTVQSSKEAPKAEESIEEIPPEWVERIPANQN